MSERADFDAVLADVLEARDRHEAVDLEALAREHPEHADALRAYLEAESWMADLAGALDTGARGDDERPIEPPDLPGFTVRREIARGGMGVVFEAEQHEPRRIVALKTLRDAVLATDEDVRRFRREAQAAAELDHPGIVRILEVGSEGRRIWYTMPLAPGGCLRQVMRDRVGRWREAATLARDVARAVAHGHARGILHRDLKPSNVLLDRRGAPLVADFGLARRVGPGIDPQTRSGTVLGTPAYMAPEQARGDVRAIDERTDIWSLGAVLHELLTGRPPFVGEGPGDTIDRVLNTEAAPVRVTAPGAPRALAAVCDQCLRQDPGDRYASMRDLADDLDRYLRGEPVRARMPGPLARAATWVRRRASTVTVAGALAVALVALGFGLHAHQQGEDLERMRRADELLATATRLAEEGDTVQAALYFAASDRVHPSERAKRGLLATLVPAPLAIHPTHPTELWRVRWSPDGERLAAGSADGRVYLWDGAGTRSELVHTDGEDVRALAFDATGARLATGDERGVVRVWDVPARRELARVTLTTASDTPPGALYSVLWLDEGRLLAGGADGRLSLWTIGARFATTTPRLRAGHDVRALAHGAAPNRIWVGLGSASGQGRLHAYDLATGTLRGIGILHDGPIWDVACDRERGRLFTVDNLGLREVTEQDEFLLREWPHGDPVGAVAFDPRERRVATATVRGRVQVFDATSGSPRGRVLHHPGQIYGVAIHPTDGRIASVGIDGTLRVWPRPDGVPVVRTLAWAAHRVKAFDLAVRPGSEQVLCVFPSADAVGMGLVPRPDASMRVEATLGEARLHGRYHAAAGTAAGWQVLHGYAEGEDGHELCVSRVTRAPRVPPARRRDARLVLHTEEGPPRALPSPPGRAALAPEAGLAVVGHGEVLHVYDVGTDLGLGDPRVTGPCDDWWLSRGGGWLLRVHRRARERFTLERTRDGSAATEHRLTEGEVARAAVSADGRLVACSLRDDRRVLVYDTRARRVLATIQHQDVLHLRLAAGGTHVVSTARNGTIRVWEAATGKPVGIPLALPQRKQPGAIGLLRVAPESDRLLVLEDGGAVVQYDVPWLASELPQTRWDSLHVQAQLAAVRTLDRDGRALAMPLDTWRTLRARHGP